MRPITALVAALALLARRRLRQNPTLDARTRPTARPTRSKLIYEDYRRDGEDRRLRPRARGSAGRAGHDRARLRHRLPRLPRGGRGRGQAPRRRPLRRRRRRRRPTATATATATASPTATAGRRRPARRRRTTARTDDGALPPPDDGTTTLPPDDGVLPHGRERPVRRHADPGAQRRAAGRPGHRPARRVGGRRRPRRSPRPLTGARCSLPGLLGCACNCWRARAHLLRDADSTTPGARPAFRTRATWADFTDWLRLGR